MRLFKPFIRRFSVAFLLIGTFFSFVISAGSAQGIARVGLLEDLLIRPGVAVEIPIEIENVVDLYGIDIELEFDPTFWEFEDADPRREGIQPAIGTFLDPGMTLFNIIDMEEGRIHLVMSQINPSEAKSGDGTIMVLYANQQDGATSIKVTSVELSTATVSHRGGGCDGEVRIGSSTRSDCHEHPVIDQHDCYYRDLFAAHLDSDSKADQHTAPDQHASAHCHEY